MLFSNGSAASRNCIFWALNPQCRESWHAPTTHRRPGWSDPPELRHGRAATGNSPVYVHTHTRASGFTLAMPASSVKETAYARRDASTGRPKTFAVPNSFPERAPCRAR